MGVFFSASRQVTPPCSPTTSRRSFGDRHSGGPFWEELSIHYTYGKSTCSVNVHQNGIAKRVDRVCVTLLDKDYSTNIVDADVVVTADTAKAVPSSRMTIRSCNFAPHKGILENWFESLNSVQAIRYFTPRRDGVFALTLPLRNGAISNKGTIMHHFETKDSHGGFAVEVKFKLEGSMGLCVNVKGPMLRHHISFTDNIEVVEDDDSGPEDGSNVNTNRAKPDLNNCGGQDGCNVNTSRARPDLNNYQGHLNNCGVQDGSNVNTSQAQPDHLNNRRGQDGSNVNTSRAQPDQLNNRRGQDGSNVNTSRAQPDHLNNRRGQDGSNVNASRAQPDLRKIGLEGFALIDEFYGKRGRENKHPRTIGRQYRNLNQNATGDSHAVMVYGGVTILNP